MMGVAALAKVMTGWSGSIVLEHGGALVTVVPEQRGSVASVIAQVTQAMRARLGIDLRAEVAWNFSGWSVRLASESAIWSLAATGTTATRTGFTGSYTGATTYAGVPSYDFDRFLVPNLGVKVPPSPATESGRVVGTGTAAASPLAGRGRTTLRLFEYVYVAWFLEVHLATGTTDRTWDVWFEGRLLGRLLLDGTMRRAPLGRLEPYGDSACELTLDATVVV